MAVFGAIIARVGVPELLARKSLPDASRAHAEARVFEEPSGEGDERHLRVWLGIFLADHESIRMQRPLCRAGSGLGPLHESRDGRPADLLACRSAQFKMRISTHAINLTCPRSQRAGMLEDFAVTLLGSHVLQLARHLERGIHQPPEMIELGVC